MSKLFITILVLLLFSNCSETKNETEMQKRSDWVPEPDKDLREKWEKTQDSLENNNTKK